MYIILIVRKQSRDVANVIENTTNCIIVIINFVIIQLVIIQITFSRHVYSETKNKYYKLVNVRYKPNCMYSYFPHTIS